MDWLIFRIDKVLLSAATTVEVYCLQMGSKRTLHLYNEHYNQGHPLHGPKNKHIWKKICQSQLSSMIIITFTHGCRAKRGSGGT